MNLRFAYVAIVLRWPGLGAGKACAQQSAPAVTGPACPRSASIPLAGSFQSSERALCAVLPSMADPAIKRFDKAEFRDVQQGVKRDAHLLVFFPGTASEPKALLAFSWGWAQTPDIA